MSAARRRLRREARQAATELLKAGIEPAHIGRLARGERLKGFMLKVVDAAEKRIDTGQGNVTVREGIAAAKAWRELDAEQREIAESEPTEAEVSARAAEDTLAEAKHEDDLESRESDAGVTPAIDGQDGRAIGRPEVCPTETTQPPPLRAAG